MKKPTRLTLISPNLFSAAVLVAAATFPLATQAGTRMETGKRFTSLSTPFDKGKLELQSSTGAYFAVGHTNERIINYTSSSYRLGLMLYTPEGDGIFRGNLELAVQALGGSVFDGPGNYLLGAGLMLRYNFVQPEAKWVPYFQIGVSGVYNDIYKDYSQRVIGRNWEFGLETAIGVRYFFNDRWSANLEGGYRHLSNADSSDRNVGLNSLGGGVGLGLHF